MKINYRHYILIFFAILSIFISSASYLFLYNRSIKQSYNYLVTKKEFENEDNRKQGEQGLIKVYNSTKETRSKLNSFLVHEDKIVDFIEMVEKIGLDSDTKLELSSINNVDGVIKANISAKGLWSNNMTALYLIENLPININIKNVRMNSLDESDKKGHIWELSSSIEVMNIK